MSNEPQGRRVDGDGPDPTTPEEVAEPGRKPGDADTEWLSIATADPAHFLKEPAGSINIILAQSEPHSHSSHASPGHIPHHL